MNLTALALGLAAAAALAWPVIRRRLADAAQAGAPPAAPPQATLEETAPAEWRASPGHEGVDRFVRLWEAAALLREMGLDDVADAIAKKALPRLAPPRDEPNES